MKIIYLAIISCFAVLCNCDCLKSNYVKIFNQDKTKVLTTNWCESKEHCLAWKDAKTDSGRYFSFVNLDGKCNEYEWRFETPRDPELTISQGKSCFYDLCPISITYQRFKFSRVSGNKYHIDVVNRVCGAGLYSHTNHLAHEGGYDCNGGTAPNIGSQGTFTLEFK